MSEASGVVLQVRRVATNELTGREVASIRALMSAAFVGDEVFAETDWDHALGGIHFFLEQDGRVASHASVVERVLWVDDQPLRTGYVEAVATDPQLQGLGLGTRVMGEASAHIQEAFQLGALGTGSHGFYRRLGWETWGGPTLVRAPDGLRRTPDEDGYILVLRTPTTPAIVTSASLICDWREGDVW
jgi:aminoglycoside 2'-N-acetyltransferase I